MQNKSIVRIAIIVALIGTTGCGPRSKHVDSAKNKILVAQYDDKFKTLMAGANRKTGKDIYHYEPIAPNVIPRKMTIQGTHHEIGQWTGHIANEFYGEALHDDLIDILRRKPENEDLNKRIVAMYEKIYPPYLDLVRGLGEVFDLTLDEIDLRYVEFRFFNALWVRLLQYGKFYTQMDFSLKGMGSNSDSAFGLEKLSSTLMGKSMGDNCSLVSSYLPDAGNHFIGRNFDGASDRPHFVVTTDIEGVYNTLGSACYFPYHWFVDGINEKGLFIGVATNGSPKAYNKKEPEYPDEPAVQVIHMVRIVMEMCATVDEAIERFGSVRIWFPAEVNHLLIADEAGNVAIVEWDLNRKMVAIRQTKPLTILTNSAFQEGIDFVRKNCYRFRKAEAVVRAKSPLMNMKTPCDMNAVHEITSVMRQTRGGGSHTLWTTYFDLKARQMELRIRSQKYTIPYTFTLD